jgi:hypothetical protein
MTLLCYHDIQEVREKRRLKAGCSQDWPPYKGWKFLNLSGAVAV